MFGSPRPAAFDANVSKSNTPWVMLIQEDSNWDGVKEVVSYHPEVEYFPRTAQVFNSSYSIPQQLSNECNF